MIATLEYIGYAPAPCYRGNTLINCRHMIVTTEAAQSLSCSHNG